jgi:hypothetical protein
VVYQLPVDQTSNVAGKSEITSTVHLIVAPPRCSYFLNFILTYNSLTSLDNAEEAKRDREEARNLLEGHIYRLRDLLDEARETTQTPFYEFSTESEREAIGSLVVTMMAWLAEPADAADTQILRTKKRALECV